MRSKPFTTIIAGSTAVIALVALNACETPISCVDNSDCPTDRVCSDDNICLSPSEIAEPATGPGQEPSVGPGAEPAAGPGAEPGVGPGVEPDPSPGPAAGSFLMPDSATAMCAFPGTCPDPGEDGYGQDGNTTAPLTTYSFVSGGIQDDINLLVWEEGHSADVMPYAQAVERCEQMAAGGRTWRVPNVRELWSIVDVGRDPQIDVAIPIPADGFFFTSSRATSTEEHFVVRFDNIALSGAVSGTAKVKCVSGENRGTANFVRVGAPADNLAKDVTTGITIQMLGFPSAYWENALRTCEELVLDGHDDWRMTTMKDLVLILNPATFVAGQPFHSFFAPESSSIWTSTIANNRHAMMNRYDGKFYQSDGDYTGSFLCARGPDL